MNRGKFKCKEGRERLKNKSKLIVLGVLKNAYLSEMVNICLQKALLYR